MDEAVALQTWFIKADRERKQRLGTQSSDDDVEIESDDSDRGAKGSNKKATCRRRKCSGTANTAKSAKSYSSLTGTGVESTCDSKRAVNETKPTCSRSSIDTEDNYNSESDTDYGGSYTDMPCSSRVACNKVKKTQKRARNKKSTKK